LFELFFADGWDKHYRKLDNAAKERMWGKIQHLKTMQAARHLKHGLPFFVVEACQYRICFEEKQNKRTVVFAGTHKQYEKWCKSQS
jgi:N-methylhydantoinase B/oxoprolinase/acetone carboxylase alpha subunit